MNKTAETIEPIDNKATLRALMARESLECKDVARMLKEHLHLTYTTRSVQQWVADESKKSSQPCPEWVITNLQEIIKKQKTSK